MGKKQQEDLKLLRERQFFEVIDDLMGGSDRSISEAEREAVEKMLKLIEGCESNPNVEFDLAVTVKYRLGREDRKKGVTETKTKRVGFAIKNGFDIPKDAVYFEVEIKPLFVLAGIGEEKVKKAGKPLYTKKVYLGKESLSEQEAKKKMKISDKKEDMYLLIQDFDECEIFRLRDVEVKTEI